MIVRRQLTRRLAVYPQSRALAFVVLDSPCTLAHWGRYATRVDKARRALRAIKSLIRIFRPASLVLEDVNDPDSRRCKRVHQLLRRASAKAASSELHVEHVTRAQVSCAFRGRDVANKDDRAALLAQFFPKLLDRVPPRRELWMSEGENMGIFDALALLVALDGLPVEPLPSQLQIYHTLLS